MAMAIAMRIAARFFFRHAEVTQGPLSIVKSLLYTYKPLTKIMLCILQWPLEIQYKWQRIFCSMHIGLTALPDLAGDQRTEREVVLVIGSWQLW